VEGEYDAVAVLPMTTCISQLHRRVGLAGTIANAEAEAAKPMSTGAHEERGVLLATNTVPAPIKDTACVEPIGAAEKAATAEPEALEAPGQAKRLRAGNTWLWASTSACLRHRHCNPT
jgi:hypothetical protein